MDRGGADIGKDVLNVLGVVSGKQRVMAEAPTVWVRGVRVTQRAEKR